MSSDDEIKMAELVGSLREELENIKVKTSKELQEANLKVRHYKTRFWFERTTTGLAILLVTLTLLSGISFLIVKSIMADSIPEYCIVSRYREEFKLDGVVDWKPDLEFGTYESIPEALATANLLQCEIRN